MSEFDFIEDELVDVDIDYDDFLASLPSDKRITIRYLRTDIEASLRTHNLFKIANTQYVKLGNISSRGALVVSHQKLDVKSKVVLILEFNDGKRFEVAAKIAHRGNDKPPYQYGIKFDRFNHDLSEHLFATEKNFNFC